MLSFSKKPRWRLVDPGKSSFRVSIGGTDLPKDLFAHIPYILVPITKTITLYVGIKNLNNGHKHTFLSDIRYVVGKGWTSNVDFSMITNKRGVEQFLKSIDKSRNSATNCMGISFFLKKLNLLGFDIITKTKGSS